MFNKNKRLLAFLSVLVLFVVGVFATFSASADGLCDQGKHLWDLAGQCVYCAIECSHERTYSEFSPSFSNTHDVLEYCEECKVLISTTNEACNFENSVCTKCDYECFHGPNLNFVYSSNKDGTHNILSYCNYCKALVETIENQTCTNLTYEYSNNSALTHAIIAICIDCDDRLGYQGDENCTFVNGFCKKCGNYEPEDSESEEPETSPEVESCTHNNKRYEFIDFNNGCHERKTYCADCDRP